jgi:hypothetical protein
MLLDIVAHFGDGATPGLPKSWHRRGIGRDRCPLIRKYLVPACVPVGKGSVLNRICIGFMRLAIGDQWAVVTFW